MNKAKLYSALAMKEMHVNDFLKELNNHGLKLSKSAYYSRIRGEQEFDIKEIKTIVKVLNLTREEMNDIFWRIGVLKDTWGGINKCKHYKHLISKNYQ